MYFKQALKVLRMLPLFLCIIVQYCEPIYEHIWMSETFLDLSQIFRYCNYLYFQFLVVLIVLNANSLQNK